MTNALLVLNAKTGEGILVNSEGSAYARYSAYLPFAGHMLDYYVNLIADYCVTEGTLNTSITVNISAKANARKITSSDFEK